MGNIFNKKAVPSGESLNKPTSSSDPGTNPCGKTLTKPEFSSKESFKEKEKDMSKNTVQSASRDIIGGDSMKAKVIYKSNNLNVYEGHSSLSKDSLQQDCEKLKTFSKSKLKENCWFEAPQFVRRRVKYVPLELSRIIDKSDDTLKKEVQQMRFQPPSGNLTLENLFVESRKSAENSVQYNPETNTPEDTKEIRLNLLSNVIAVIGSAGIGKSFLCKKMLHLIDTETIKTEFIFYLKFREIDYEKSTNLLTFLTGKAEYENYNEERITKLVNSISESQNAYLICDGLDEMKFSANTESNFIVNIHNSKAENFIIGLLCGKILPKFKKLITSRPRSLWELPQNYQPHFIVQILGINKDSQKKLCDDVCGDDASDDIFDHVQRYKVLSFYCHIPLFSTLIFHILSVSRNQAKSSTPKSITQIFVVLIILYTDDKSGSRGEVPLKKLCSLALHGILNGKIFFDHDDMKTFGLEKCDKNDFTVTIQCQDTKNPVSLFTKATVQNTYFGHLGIQELFAALQIVLFENVKKCKELLFAPDCKINLLDTDYDVFALSMFGLFNEVTYHEYLLNLSVKFNHEFYKQKVLLFKRFIENTELRYRGAKLRYNALSSLTKFSYKIVEFIYELGDVTMTRQFANNLKNRINITVGVGFSDPLLPNQFLPLNYLLRHRSKEIELKVRCSRDADIRFLTELGVTLEENPNVKLMELNLYMQITDEIVSASETCFKKVVKRIEVDYVGPGFTSNDVALKFATCIMERETKLVDLICIVSTLSGDLDQIAETLQKCQQNVKNKIDIIRFKDDKDDG